MENKFTIKDIEKHWNTTAQQDVMHYIAWQGDWKTSDGKQRFYVQGAEEVKHTMEDIKSNTKMLEVGCGIGRQTFEFSNWFHKVIAVDLSEKMIIQAKENTPKDITNIEFRKINGISLESIKDNSIDFVYSFIVLQHIIQEEAVKLIKEMCRVLKQGGTIRFQFYNIKRNNIDINNPHTLQYLDVEVLKKLFNKAHINATFTGLNTKLAWATGTKEIITVKPTISSFSNFKIDTIHQELLQFKKHMNNFKAPFFLMGGTLLGIYRDNKLLSYDNDIDIGVFEDVNLQDLYTNFKTLDYDVGIHLLQHGNILWVKKFFDKNVLVFEIEQHYVKDNKIFYNRDLGKKFAYKKGKCVWDKKDFFPFVEIQFLKETFNIPKNTENYLNTYYKNWKQPEQYVDWRYHCNNLTQGWL